MNPPRSLGPDGWLGRAKAGVAGISDRRARLQARQEAEYVEAWDDAIQVEERRSDRIAARDAADAVPWGVRVAAEAGWRLLVLAATVWVLMRVIGAVRLVVLAFAVSLLITALLQPTVARLQRRGVPRGVATALTAVCGFVVLGLVGWFVVWQVLDNLDTLSGRVQEGIGELKQWLVDSPLHVTEGQINDVADRLSDSIGTSTSAITSTGLQGVTVLVEGLTGLLLAMFCTLFLLYDGARIWDWTLKLVPSSARPGLAGAGPRAWRTLTAYVRGTVIVALIDAVFIGVGIYILDVPLAVPIAVLIFLASFVPLVGAVASGALAVVVALVTQGVFTALMALVIVLVVQQIEGHVLQPFILGRAVRVHPLAVVLAVATGATVAGIGGAVVAVPLVAVGNTVIGYLRSRGASGTAAPDTIEPAAGNEGGTGPETGGGDGPGHGHHGTDIPRQADDGTPP
ncbi:AI-2E family transporter [Streptomyces antarcticus]|uniref:AI-2E family transporter n=1 Tax=Streptomyces antarcticus TaxID=2996458 RepID=UPI00226E42C3|nr:MULTISPECIES: AI-2E family transporter [unclassified Streptomyces]MCY0943077.1 AI-2E family transporter [Streptomyces sp. H34-AA3]MCZ4084438.1 AI-2E family transporter [Streptomyces sp. H34-S5]